MLQLLLLLKMLNRFLIIIILLTLFSCRKDSERSELGIQSTKEAVQFYKEGDDFYFRYEYENAIDRYMVARTKALEGDSLRLLSLITNDIGLCYKKLGKYDSAIKYYELAIAIDQVRADTISLAGRWRNLGNVYESQGWHAEAIRLQLNALDLLSKSYKQKTAPIYLAIGNIFLNQQDYSEAIRYYKISASILQHNRKNSNLSLVHNNLGTAFLNLHEYDSADYHLRKALNIKINSDSSLLPTTLNSLGDLNMKTGAFDSAYMYFVSSHKVLELMGDSYGIAENNLWLARLNIKRGKLAAAKSKILATMTYARNQGTRDLSLECYELLAEVYFGQKDYKRAYGFLKEWSDMRDSVFNKNKIETERIISQYELDEKEEQKQHAEQNAINANLRAETSQLIVLLLSLIVLVLIIPMIVIYQQRRKLKGLNTDLTRKNEKIDALNQQNFHFTKNSLTGIVSILNTQLGHFKGQEVYAILLEEKLRMESINILYNLLFNDSQGSAVGIRNYLKKVIHNTIDNILPDRDIEMNLNICDIHVDNQVAFALGIIANEICLNSCKYALNHGNRFYLNFECSGSLSILHIGDNGPGLPEGVNWSTSNSFGLRLIRLLVEELDASIKLDSSNKGLNYKISFNHKPNE